MGHITRIITALIPVLILSACLLTPGKFTSSLDIRKDGHFTFAYKGEVIARDFEKEMKGLKKAPGNGQEDEPDQSDGQDTAYYRQTAATDPSPEASQERDKTLKMQAIAQALSKEKGYHSVRYIGNGRFDIDYQISGKLDHSFLFPFNVDAQAIFPFVAIEVRADGKIRVQAPGFANGGDKSGGPMGAMGRDENRDLDGTFTLVTDAEILSQNQENGPIETPQGKQLVWKATPLTQIAPMAVLRLSTSQ